GPTGAGPSHRGRHDIGHLLAEGCHLHLFRDVYAIGQDDDRCLARGVNPDRCPGEPGVPEAVPLAEVATRAAVAASYLPATGAEAAGYGDRRRYEQTAQQAQDAFPV